MFLSVKPGGTPRKPRGLTDTLTKCLTEWLTLPRNLASLAGVRLVRPLRPVPVGFRVLLAYASGLGDRRRLQSESGGLAADQRRLHGDRRGRWSTLRAVPLARSRPRF